MLCRVDWFTITYLVVENDRTFFNSWLCDLLYLIDFAFSSNVEKKKLQLLTVVVCVCFTLYVGPECNFALSALGHIGANGVFLFIVAQSRDTLRSTFSL